MKTVLPMSNKQLKDLLIRLILTSLYSSLTKYFKSNTAESKDFANGYQGKRTKILSILKISALHLHKFRIQANTKN